MNDLTNKNEHIEIDIEDYRQLYKVLGKDDIQAVINSFYDSIREHPGLGGFFRTLKIGMSLRPESVIFGGLTLAGNAIGKIFTTHMRYTVI